MMAALQGKTALVTGASLGIGRATASALPEAGAHVLAHYGRSVQDAESLVAEIQRGGPGALDLEELDLVDVEGVRLLNACEAEGISVRAVRLISGSGCSGNGGGQKHGTNKAYEGTGSLGE